MRAGTSSRTITIAILLAFAMVALGQLTKEQPPQGQTDQSKATGGQQANTSPANAKSKSAGDSNSANTNAQQPGASVQQNSNAPTATNLAIRGCLMQGKEGYTLLQDSTDTTFKLLGEDAQFAGASGKVIEARGRELEPVAGSMNMPRFQVSDVKVVADQCPVTPKAALPNSGAAGTARNPEPDATPRYEPNNPNQTPPTVPINPNTPGASGAPSAGTGNPPPPAKPPVF